MNQPIDILKIASERYAQAVSVFQMTNYMQAGPCAEVAAQYAIASLDAARCDLRAAHTLCHDLAQLGNQL